MCGNWESGGRAGGTGDSKSPPALNCHGSGDEPVRKASQNLTSFPAPPPLFMTASPALRPHQTGGAVTGHGLLSWRPIRALITKGSS